MTDWTYKGRGVTGSELRNALASMYPMLEPLMEACIVVKQRYEASLSRGRQYLESAPP